MAITEKDNGATAMNDKVTDTIMAVFKNTLNNCTYIFKNGKAAAFLNGEYLTNNEKEIRELMEEVQEGHPHIYVDKENCVRDIKFVDPMEAIRAQVRAELVAEQAAISKGDTDLGNSDKNEKLNVTTTANVASAMSGSTSMDAAPAGGAKIVAGPVGTAAMKK